MKTQHGFTLIELLVVIIIVGILASIAVPKYIVQRDKARAVEAIQQIGVLAQEIQSRDDFELTTNDLTDLGYDNVTYGDTESRMSFNYRYLSGTNRVVATYKNDPYETIIFRVDTGVWSGSHPGVPE